MPGCSDTLAELRLPQLQRSRLIGTCLLSSLPSAIRLLAPLSPPQASTPFFAVRRFQKSARMALNRRTRALFARHVRTQIFIKIKMQNKQIQQYNGYAIQSSSHRLSDGSFSSNLLLERIDSARAEGRYWFYSLDYFKSEEQALQHSAQWALNWVDTRG
jgi:hypothetical protein